MLKYSRNEILVMWLLDLFCSLIVIFTPMLIGLAIDDLASGKYELSSLLLFALVVKAILEFLYRRYDTRIYDKISVAFKNKYFTDAIEHGIKTSEIDANSELIDDFSEFLRFFVLNIMKIFSIIVPIIYLFIEADSWVALAAGLITAAVIILQFPLQRDMQQEISRIRDENEKRRDIIGKRDILPYANYLNRIMDFSVNYSDKDAKAYIVSSLCQLGLLAFAAWYIVSSGFATTGVIFAAVTYIIELNEKSLELPEIYADYLRLKDSAERITRNKSS